MIRDLVTRPVGRSGRLVACAAVLALSSSLVIADAYDPTASYYQAATGSGATLKSQLRTIISSGFVARTYGDARYAFAVIDKDPNNANNILLVYNRGTISSTWNGTSFNREHLWPQSLLNVDASNGYSGPGSDLFELRPSNVQINSDRGNDPYGYYTNSSTTYGSNTGPGGAYYFPGNPDRGDVARSMFYMATRYSNLTLVNGQPSTFQMGDLASLLRYHYQDEVDTFERRRNQTIYSSALNPTYYQGNRNPYIDHPEYVWSVFGSGANTSQLSVATPDANGASAVTVNLGKVIAGSSFGTQNVTLNKTGATPTTFDVTVAGSISSTLDGPRHSFDFDSLSRSLTVAVTGSTSTIGSRNGTITFNNTDITTGAAAGQGASDGDDTINVTAAVVGHADPSFSLASSQKSLSLDFGIIARDSTSPTLTFDIVNRSSTGNNAFTAGLDIDGITSTGNTAAFATDLATSTNLAAGTALAKTASILTTATGSYNATFSIVSSDENIPGASSFAAISLALNGRIAIAGDATLDNTVNFDDLLLLAQNYGSTTTIWQTGDFSRDNATNFDDLLALAQNYGLNGVIGNVGDEFGGSFAADWALARSLVPEPTTLSLLALPAMVVRRRR